MANRTVKVDAWDKAIADILKDYKGALSEGLNEDIKTTAEDTKKKLRTAPTPKRSGDYRKNWSVKYVTSKATGITSAVVHVKAPDYRLTHLLEFGHASRNGGRVKAYPHIADAEYDAVNELYEKAKQIVQNG